MQIRPATPTDADAIAAILLPVFRAGDTYAIECDISRDAALAYWMAPAHDVSVAVGDDGELLGTFYLRANQRGGGAHVANAGYVTAAAARGRGVARAMCAHSLDRARAAGFRAVPGAIVRRSAFIGKGAVLMPSFVNLGAHVGEGTMVDTWATVGSCAQIGKNVHLSGGVGIGGVLEPLQAGPTIIEDECFIGARSEVVEGCIVREGSVLGMGVFIGQSTKIVDRETGQVMYGEVPAGSVVVAGSMPSKNGVNLYCAVIVKRVDARTRAKTSVNELLRD